MISEITNIWFAQQQDEQKIKARKTSGDEAYIQRVSFKSSQRMLHQLDEVAENRNVSKGVIIREALAEYLKTPGFASKSPVFTGDPGE